MPPSRVFISYRRDDSAPFAGRIYDRLEAAFGGDCLFMDVDKIQLGADFVDAIVAEVAQCDVLLAIIGPGWLYARDGEGNRRLESEQDFVRIEIAAALKRRIPVIPILLEGTCLPKAEQLPADLKGLVRRNALDVRHTSFHRDMSKLVSSLQSMSLPQVSEPSSASHLDPLAQLAYLLGGRGPKHQPETPSHATGTLDTLSVDIAQMIDTEAAADQWERYHRGERGIDGRKLYSAEGQQAFEEIRDKYRSDTDFRQTVEHFIHEFDLLLDDVSRSDHAAVRYYLTSDTGKVYIMLAHAAGRFE